MKNLIIILLFSASILSSCGGQQNALDYNAQLSQQNDRVVDGVITFFAYMENDDYASAEKERIHLAQVCDSVVNEMQKIGGYKNDNQLLNALVNYVQLQKELAQVEYKKLIEANNIIDQIDNATSEPDIDAIAKAYEQIDMYRDSIDYKDSIFYQKAVIVQKKFGLKHGFIVEEGEEE